MIQMHKVGILDHPLLEPDDIAEILSHTRDCTLGLCNLKEIVCKLNPGFSQSFHLHIGGTNGKFSTAAFISSTLMEAGYNVGRFISPAVVLWNERVSQQEIPISKSDCLTFLQKIYPFIDQLTRFEAWTLIAMLYFAQEPVPDMIIWEIGLGGRLDATNAMSKHMTVITNISYDHMDKLGYTLSEIASEKAGIMQKDVPMIVGDVPSSIKNIFLAQAHKAQAPLFFTKPLKGYYHTYHEANQLLSLTVLDHIQKYGFSLNIKHIKRGFFHARLPGRFEQLTTSPTIILDGAHNEKGIESLLQTLRNYDLLPATFLISAAIDKQLNIFSPVFKHAKRMIVADICAFKQKFYESYHMSAILKQMSPKNLHIDIWCNPAAEVLNWYRFSKSSDILVVTGSFYLISLIRGVLLSVTK